MCEIIGHPAVRLVRVGMGTLRLGNLPAGKFRVLSSEEVEKLRSLAVSEKKQASKNRRRSRPRSKSSSGKAPKSGKS